MRVISQSNTAKVNFIFIQLRNSFFGSVGAKVFPTQGERNIWKELGLSLGPIIPQTATLTSSSFNGRSEQQLNFGLLRAVVVA